MTNKQTKTYYLAINRNTKQYFIGYSSLKAWYSFRYEHKTLENAGDYEDYIYYQFDNLDNLMYTLNKNLNILSEDVEAWALLNKQINYRHQLRDYLTARCDFDLVAYTKTDRGYIFGLI